MARAAGAQSAGAAAGAQQATERDLTLAFVALELQLSALAQEALAEGALGSMRTRREYHSRAQRLIGRMRVGFRQHAREVLETAYDDGARLVGARPMGLVRRHAIAAIVDSAVERLDSSLVTVGRRFDDTFRRVGLQQAARQIARELPERAAAGLIRRDLMAKGLTGFVDKSDRRWTLSNYSRMVIRTTTSQAANRGVADAVLTVGRDLVRISLPEGHPGCHHHPHDPQNPCRSLEGKTLSLTGHTPGYPVIRRIPPFHPNCQHGLAPAPEGAR
jgi:hypothetical protein